MSTLGRFLFGIRLAIPWPLPAIDLSSREIVGGGHTWNSSPVCENVCRGRTCSLLQPAADEKQEHIDGIDREDRPRSSHDPRFEGHVYPWYRPLAQPQ
jgi:hypothetical protein